MTGPDKSEQGTYKSQLGVKGVFVLGTDNLVQIPGCRVLRGDLLSTFNHRDIMIA